MISVRMFYYDELSDQAKAAARANVVIPEVEALIRNVGNARQAWKENIHRAINDPYHVRRIYNGQMALYKIRHQGEAYLIPYIRQNCTIYLADGSYVYYDCNKKRIAIVNSGYHGLLPDDLQVAARDEYVRVNDRGPAYFRKLYSDIAKAKRSGLV